MGNPALHYPGDGGCSYSNCPNRSSVRIKRGTFMPLGEIKFFSAGTGIHVECMNHILRSGGGTLDDVVESSHTTDVVSKEVDHE